MGGAPLVWLRLEGLAVLAVAAIAYGRLGQPWWMFVVLFFVPDLSMLGYALNPRVGATAYNTAHNSVLPLLLAGCGLLLGKVVLLALAVIWLGHIGFDRALGYGLKYRAGFAYTHLGRIGKAAKPAVN